MGLNQWARELLAQEAKLLYTEQITRVYPDGHRETIEPRQIYFQINRESYGVDGDHSSLDYSAYGHEYYDEWYLGAIGPLAPLVEYTFSDGRIFIERVQEVESKKTGWFFSEETYFLALKIYDPKTGNEDWASESLWTEEEMARAMTLPGETVKSK